MQAILYVCHGSRVQKGIDESCLFINQVKKRLNIPIQEICFLELATPSIAEGIASCVTQGATKIAVLPILLLTAVHAKNDIPLELEKSRKQYPNISITFGEPLGIHPKMIRALHDQLPKMVKQGDDSTYYLLVGRGSSDHQVKYDLQTIANMFQQKYTLQNVGISFLYGASPKYEEALDDIVQTRYKRVVILPYLLFSGLLIRGMRKKCAQLEKINQEIIICEPLGDHPYVQDVLIERVNNLIFSLGNVEAV